MENKEQFEETTRTAPSRDSSQPSSSNSANSSSNGNQSSDSSTNQSALQNPSQEDSEEIVLKADLVIQDNYSLKQFIKEHPDGIAIEEAEPIIRGMANALVHANNEGIIHLDFKPSNVFYEIEKSDGEKITLIDDERLGGVTEAYASCEMLSDEKPDKRDDIYALACVTYELLSGKHPFDRKKATQAEEENLSPKPIKGLQRQQNQALLHGLAFNREERTPDAEQFLAGLFPEKNGFSLGLVGLIVGSILLAGLAGVAVFFQFWSPQTSIDIKLQECKQHFEVGHSTGQWDNALTCYQDILALEPKNHDALVDFKKIEVAQLLGQCKQDFEAGIQTKKFEAARACYQEVQKIEPNNEKVLAALNEIEKREKQGEDENVNGSNINASTLTPLEIKLQKCEQHFEAGHLTMGNKGTAFACYKEVLDSGSSNAAALDGFMKIKRRYVRGLDTASKYEQSKMVQRLEQALALVEKELGKEVILLLQKCGKHLKTDKGYALTCYQAVLELKYDEVVALASIKTITETGVNASLQTCQKHFEANRLSSGIGGNALDCYKKILRQDPDNDEAQKSLKAIEKRYEEWANKALRKRKFNKVRGYLASLEKVDPHSSILADLKRRLKQALR